MPTSNRIESIERQKNLLRKIIIDISKNNNFMLEKNENKGILDSSIDTNLRLLYRKNMDIIKKECENKIKDLETEEYNLKIKMVLTELIESL